PSPARWAGKDSNLRSRSDWFTASSLCPLGHRPVRLVTIASAAAGPKCSTRAPGVPRVLGASRAVCYGFVTRAAGGPAEANAVVGVGARATRRNQGTVPRTDAA